MENALRELTIDQINLEDCLFWMYNKLNMNKMKKKKQKKIKNENWGNKDNKSCLGPSIWGKIYIVNKIELRKDLLKNLSNLSHTIMGKNKQMTFYKQQSMDIIFS